MTVTTAVPATVVPACHGGLGMPGLDGLWYHSGTGEVVLATLRKEITAYEMARDDLELDHPGKWVVFRNGSMIDAHDTFQLAAEDATRRFGRGPYLIRKVGAPPLNLSVAARR